MPPRPRQVENLNEEHELRRQGGQWLKHLRERAGHTQRSFAVAVGVDYYTFISQIETGRGSVPKERFKTWSAVLGLQPAEFLKEYMRYWEPISYDILFSGNHIKNDIDSTPGDAR